jgi:hypothetical protein
VKKFVQLTIISAVSLGLGAGCGIFKKKKSGGSSPLEQALENPDLNAYEGYSTAKFQGSREEAIHIAGQLLIDTNLNIISDGSQTSGLRLQGFGGETYDTLQTYSHVHDPSLSMLKSVRSMLCVLSKINYVSIPEGEQTVSTQIKECLPRSASASSGSSSGGSSGSSGSSGQSSGSSSTSSKENLGLADITWEAYVNVDKQLIVTLNYPEKGAQEWMPTLDKEVTIVVSEGASASNPFGRYFIRIKGQQDQSSMGGMTKLALEEPGSVSTKGSSEPMGMHYAMQAKMVVDTGTVVGGKADQVYVAYSENFWGNDKRMAGIFDVATSTGAITKGEFVADIKGFDPESNEPGGAFRVTFNQDRLHREKNHQRSDRIFRP